MRYKIITFISLLSLLTNIYAQKPELKGFYKFDFGISYAKAKDIINEVGRIRNDDFNSDEFLTWNTSSFANHPLFALSQGITLKFYNSQFYSSIVPFSGAFNAFDEIKTEITSKYFHCDISQPNYSKWIFSNGDYIELQYSTSGEDAMTKNVNSQVTMIYVNKSISDIEKSDKTKKNMKYF